MDWLAAARAGDSSALWVGLEAGRPELVRRVRRELRIGSSDDVVVADVVHRALAKGFTRFEQFGGATWGQWISWLAQIASNLIADDGRDRAREPESLDGMLDDLGSWVMPRDRNDTPRTAAQKKEIEKRAIRAIEDLPKAERTAVTLYFQKGMPLDKIAEQLGKTRAAVKVARDWGVARIRTALGIGDEV